VGDRSTGGWPVELDLRLHHIAVVVSDLDLALAQYLNLGFPVPDRFEVPEQMVKVVIFQAGPGYVELIQPTDPAGPIARFLHKRGEGMHHVAYQVTDIEQALSQLVVAGVRLIDETPRRGVHDWRIAFVHPESCAGVLTELVEVPS
jgi:methylmalonyl-CoA/ethylmalonyl-CoA epimerase